MTPSEKAQFGVRQIEEAIIEVLSQTSPLHPSEISQHLGIPPYWYDVTGARYDIIYGVLAKLQEEGIVEPQGWKPRRWKLTKTEGTTV